jgi:mevalonate kinase
MPDLPTSSDAVHESHLCPPSTDTHTACGKVILLGEHAVVYNHPALAAGLERGAEACWSPGDHPLQLVVSPWDVTITCDQTSALSRALAALLAALPGERAVTGMPTGTVRATVHLPGGGGLGSSAALAVAVARALAPVLLGHQISHQDTLAAALAWEQVFHGNPSGVDHTMAATGGAAMYSRTDGLIPLTLSRPVRLVIADTGERTSTRTMVESVARFHARRADLTDKIFDAIAALVRNGALALSAGDGKALGQLMDLNQALLSSLFVSTERTEDLCRVAREAGALGAKLTGGGGGGCIIALPDRHEDAVRTALERAGAATVTAEIRDLSKRERT